MAYILSFGDAGIKEQWVPDWMDVSQYPHAENTSNQQWAWEFLRRNPNYQQAWEDGPGILKPLRERIADGSYREKTDESINKIFSERFGISPPKHPSIDDGSGIRFERTKLVVASRYTSKTLSYSLSEGEMLLSFDLQLPIEPQMKKAKEVLLKYRQDYVDANKDFFNKDFLKDNSKPNTAMFTAYLRILDAISAGIPRKDIAKHLYPGQDAVKKRLENHLTAAIKIRDFGYLLIAQYP